MKVFRNFTPGEAIIIPNENEASGEAKIFTLKDSDGNDWYDIQSLFSENSLKVAFGADSVIYSMSTDASALWPVNMSVAEIPDSEVPEGAVADGTWMFDGQRIMKKPVDYVLEAERKKSKLMEAANATIAPLQDAVDLGIATDAESALLLEWKKYRVLLSRIEPSRAPDIKWPPVPVRE